MAAGSTVFEDYGSGFGVNGIKEVSDCTLSELQVARKKLGLQTYLAFVPLRL